MERRERAAKNFLLDSSSIRLRHSGGPRETRLGFSLHSSSPDGRPEPDVQLKVLYCGICHSDLHLAKNDLGFSIYPLVPGHEIVGVVTEVGSKVRKVKVGDKVGVGCMVGSCRKCDQCVKNLENYCPKPVFTYNSIDSDGTVTYGGYSDIMVADEHFIIRWPETLPLDRGSPLLCAGTTTYSALRYYGLDKPGLHVGVVGLGGLGHVAVKFLKAFGAKVTVISTSAAKKKDAIETLGADGFLVSRAAEEMNAAAGTLDGIIDTVSAVHPIQPLISLLKPHGKMVVVGVRRSLSCGVPDRVGAEDGGGEPDWWAERDAGDD
ncbi:hypothetical protein DH2020_034943 [Rehmannia glutinosa]|uniref:Enoyl reductase (ER) domain-containing protein n=1 Tax=Rehmannia glutinosa TaxID=99300 RepID=A0ABR0VAS2_REHGL